MKAWIKATIVALLAIFSTSCSLDYDDEDYVPDPFYTFADKTWSRIEETVGYNYFVCYEFYKDGAYSYWFYEYDDDMPHPIFSVENGRWEAISHGGSRDEIRLYRRGCSDTYEISQFLKGLSSCNFSSDINDYKKAIDDLYYNGY